MKSQQQVWIVEAVHHSDGTWSPVYMDPTEAGARLWADDHATDPVYIYRPVLYVPATPAPGRKGKRSK